MKLFSQNRRTPFVRLALVTLSVGLGTISIVIQPAQGQVHWQEFVDSIRSVEQVKEELRHTFESRDSCGVGSWVNMTSTSICETVAALDVQVNGQIVGGMTSVGSDRNIPISSSDLELMQLIFSQCKPTTYQFGQSRE